MPTESPFPWVEIPNVDLWDFIFERRDRPFPDDKGKLVHTKTFWSQNSRQS